jgi:hypothetical protein
MGGQNYGNADTVTTNNQFGYDEQDSSVKDSNTFLCMLTIIPVKMSLRTFCLLQYWGDVIFGLINLAVFGLASLLLGVRLNYIFYFN